jgi:hypothetical protein
MVAGMSDNWNDAAERTYTPQQILSDPRSATHVALEYCNGEMATCLEKVAQLEAENAALWAFVDAADRRDAWDMDGARIALRQYEAERQRLATDYGVPLPGQEGATEDEFGYCDECGEPLMFASMSTCASCAWNHES